MDLSNSEVYGIVSKLDNLFLNDDTTNMYLYVIYTTYANKLLKINEFAKVAAKVNSAKHKYLKKSLKFVTHKEIAIEEENYYSERIHTIINVFMDVLVVFIKEYEPENVNPLKVINERWQNLNDYWINSNKNTALDTQWVISNLELPVAKQPENFRIIYKMFVLLCLIRAEVLMYPNQNFANLPRFSSMYMQFLK